MTKNLIVASMALFHILFFVSCNKELSFEQPANPAGTAKYFFEGLTGSCSGAVVAGSFMAGTAMNSTNTVTLSVNVDSLGSYIVNTDEVNGISFSGSGVFTDIGTQFITLTASGNPITAGVNDYTTAVNGCKFSITVDPGNGSTNQTAIYSFNGGTAACTGAVVSGVFTAGTATSSANTVVLQLTVTKAGNYSISTNSVNGIQFTRSGSFATTGAQTITLTATGTPTASGTYAFIPGPNGCTFNVTVGSGGGGSGNFLRCKINGVLTNFNKSLVGYYVTPPVAGIPFSISVQGKNSDVANSIEELWVSITNPTAPTTGVYNNRTFSTGMTDRSSQVAFYPTGFPNLYWSSSVFTANTLSVNITSVSASSAAGTFQGTIYDTNGGGSATKNVTEGEFKITF